MNCSSPVTLFCHDITRYKYIVIIQWLYHIIISLHSRGLNRMTRQLYNIFLCYLSWKVLILLSVSLFDQQTHFDCFCMCRWNNKLHCFTKSRQFWWLYSTESRALIVLAPPHTLVRQSVATPSFNVGHVMLSSKIYIFVTLSTTQIEHNLPWKYEYAIIHHA